MTQLELEILEPGQHSRNPIPDSDWLLKDNIEKIFLIERATIKKFDDGRYPQIQLVFKEADSGKFISVGTTARIMNMIVVAAKAAAQSQGLTDF